MGLLDTLPQNGQPAGSPQPPGEPSGGLLGSLPMNGGGPSRAPSASLMEAVSPSPSMTPAAQQYFPGLDPTSKTSYAPSGFLDTNALQYQTYGNGQFAPPATASLDPRLASPTSLESFTAPRTVANRVALQNALGSAFSPSLDASINKLLSNGVSPFSTDVKAKVTAQYPLTPAAQKFISGTSISQGKQSDPGFGGTYTRDTGSISLANDSEVPAAAEMFNAIYSARNTSPVLYNSAWDEAKKNDESGAIDHIDSILSQPPYSKMSPDVLAQERFSQLAAIQGKAGLTGIPKELQPFYKEVLAPESDALIQKAHEVINGKTSLMQAHLDLADSKGNVDEAIMKYAREAASAANESDYANSTTGMLENSVGQIYNWAKTLGEIVLEHGKSAIQNPLTTGQGVVQTAVVKPISFLSGIGNAILIGENHALDAIFHTHISQDPDAQPTNPLAVIGSMNDTIDRTPDEQKAYDAGNFLGWIVPYSKISAGVEFAADATKIGSIAPKIAPLLPYISDAAGFLGTGQVLHNPGDGSRVQQLKNDAIALAFFDIGGFALKGGATMALTGLSKILSKDAQAAADKILTPVITKLGRGGSVSADTLDHAITRAKGIIEEDTGKTPQELIQEHIGATKEPEAPQVTTTKIVESNPAIGRVTYEGKEYELIERTSDNGAVVREPGTMGTRIVPLDKVTDVPTGKTPVSSDAAAETYWNEKIAPEMEKGNAVVIGADDLKYHFDDFDRANHPLYSKAANDLLMRAAKESPSKDVMFTAGGPGSGKSEVVANLLKQTTDGVIYDSNLSSLDGALKQINELEAMGKKVQIVSVLRDPESAYHFVKTREAEGGHPVTDKAFVKNHAIVPENLLGLMDHGKDVKVIDVRGITTREGLKNLPIISNDEAYARINAARLSEDEISAIVKRYGVRESRSNSGTESATVPRRSTPRGNTRRPTNERGTSEEILRGIQQRLQEASDHRSILEDVLADHPARVFMKYRLPGTSWGDFSLSELQAKGMRTGGKNKSLDDIVSEAGYSDLDHAQKGLDDLLATRDQVKSIDTKIRDLKADLRAEKGSTPAPRVRNNTPVTLPEFPEQARPLFGVAFPGANYVAKFIEKDIIEKFGSAKDAITGIYKATKDLFGPASLEKQKAAAVVGSSLMKEEKYKSSAWAVAEKRRDWWANMKSEDHLDFLDHMEEGEVTANDMTAKYGRPIAKTMADMANEYRDRLNKAFDGEEDAGVQKNYIEDYVPHYWTDPEAAKAVFQKFYESFGKGRFNKMRTIDLIREGIDHGLELKTTNPEELTLLREIDGQRLTTRIGMMKELEHYGLASRDLQGKKNWPLVNGPDGNRYAVTPDAKTILDNAFFSKSLYSMNANAGEKIASSIFRSIMTVKGIVTPIKLSLSLFHPIHITFIDSSSERARIWEGIIKGNLRPAEALKQLAAPTTLANQVSDMLAKNNYSEIVDAWNKPMDQLSDRQRTIVQYIIDGGGSPKMSEEFKIRAADGFKKAIADENYIGAAIRGLPKVIEKYQSIFFETYIPALKIGSYARGAEELLRTKPELATDDLARKMEFRKLWQSMDNRFGQMVYKTNFWNPIMKEVGQAAFLSLGWQVGFVREFGGGALDLAKFLGKGAVGRATVDDVTQKMLFSIDYSIQAALIGGIMTYAMTGKLPQGPQDLFFPNTGKINPDGSEARVNTSFYTREYFGFVNHYQKEGLIKGSVSMLKNKMSPMLGSMAEIYQNKDFYGYQIHDPNDSVATQAEQLLAYIINNDFSPISFTGAQQASQTTGILGQALSYAGFNPAPKYIAQTGIQTKIFSILDERMGAGVKPLDAKPAADAKSNIRKLYESGNTDEANTALEQAVKDGYVKEAGRTTFIKNLDLPADVRAFKSLAQFPSDQENLLSQMSEEDLARYATYASNDIKSRLSSLSPAAKKFVDDLNAGKIKLVTFKAGKAVDDSK